MKAILKIEEMPKSCSVCKLRCEVVCSPLKREIFIFEGLEARPQWCPLKPDDHGIWTPYDEDSGCYECSHCMTHFYISDGTPKENGYDFCPRCGVRMESEARKDETSNETANNTN